MANDSGGVWRTISGRRVFIRNGQSLSSAMKASGKFKNATKNKKTTNRIKEDIAKQKMNKFANENIELYKKHGGFNLDTGNEKANAENRKAWEKWLENKDKLHKYKDESRKAGETWRNEDKKSNDWKSEEGGVTRKETKDGTNYIQGVKKADGSTEYTRTDYDKKGNELSSKTYKSLDEAKAGGSKNEFTREELKSKYGTDNTDVINAGKEKGDRVSLKSEKSTSENDKIKQMYKDTWKGKMQYEELRNKLGQLEKERKVSREELNKLKYDASLETDNWQNNPKNAHNSEYIGNNTVATKEKSTSDYMNEKIRSRGKTKFEEDLPRKTEIKTQGTSNRKEVSENIQAHILEHYDSPDDFIQQMDAMRAPTMWQAGKEIAEGGSYLLYDEDISNYLNDLKINPKGKSFDRTKAFNTYTNLVGRESAKLYTRIQRNAYNKYKKEHPLTQMSFEDFQKMNKK